MGSYGYPPEEGARVAVSTVAEHLRGDTSLVVVRFVLKPATFAFFEAALVDVRGSS